jgi:hypothetical protein
MSENRAFALLLIGNFLLLVAQIQSLSISFFEAEILYGNSSAIGLYVTSFLDLFGSNDYVLRLPMIALHLFSMVLLYAISSHYVTRPYDRIWILLVYALLPGVMSAALLVNSAGLKIALLFLFAYIYLKNKNYSLLVLPFFLLLDTTVIYFYVTIIIFETIRKNYPFAAITGVLFLVAVWHFNSGIGGVPQGHFLDTLAIYLAIFSPIVFVYLFYVLYRRFIFKQRDLLWAISFSMFLFSLVLSFRQKVNIQEFAPYLMFAIPLAAQTFLHTYRVRLPQFRKRYGVLFYSAFTLLVVNFFAVLGSQIFYAWVKNPQKHFSYPLHVAKELAKELENEGFECVKSDPKMQKRLRFYGIGECKRNVLSEESTKKGRKVTIRYIDVPIYTGYVTKVNK